MTTMSKVPDDHPLMIAWNEYKAGPDFENTKQWATAPKHTEGSLWAAFMAGWYKAVALQAQQPAAPSGEAVATVAGEFSEVRQDGEVYWLQTVLLKQPQQLPFGAPLYTTPPPSAVPEGLTARDRSVLRFALHRFMGEAYARHNEASQKTTAGLYASGAAERFYRDAKDAERLLSVFAAAPEPGEAAGGQRLRPLLDPGPEPMNDNRNTPNCELCRQALRSALGDGPALPLDAVGIQGDTKLCIGCGQSLPGQPAAPEPGEVDSD